MSPTVPRRQRFGLARLKRDLLWQILCLRARSRGIDPRRLDRVRIYLSTSFGLNTPPYSEPLQRPRNCFPGLSARPVYAASEFSWSQTLEAAAQDIRAEFDAVGASLHAHPQDLAVGHWDVFYFNVAGRAVASHHRRCPATSAAIAAVPGGGRAGQAYFSVIRPGTRIAPHYGPTNTRLRCHLGLHVPSGSWIRIGRDWHAWQEGKCLIFDDSFEHEVHIDGATERVVLIVDFWHPDLTEEEIAALRAMMAISSGVRRYRRAARLGRSFTRP